MTFYFRCQIPGCQKLLLTVRDRDKHEAYERHCPSCGESKGEELTAENLHAVCDLCIKMEDVVTDSLN